MLGEEERKQRHRVAVKKWRARNSDKYRESQRVAKARWRAQKKDDPVYQERIREYRRRIYSAQRQAMEVAQMQ